MNLMRPPKGEFSERVLAIAQNLGYKTVFWSFAYVDWENNNQPDKAQSLQKVTNAAHNGAIYLLHATSKTNSEILSQAIDDIRQKGFEFDLFK